MKEDLVVFLRKGDEVLPLTEKAKEISGALDDSKFARVELPEVGEILISFPGFQKSFIDLIHDSRIILTSIMGYAELLEMELNGRNRELASKIREEVTFLCRLFEDALTLEKRKDKALKKTSFEICDLLHEIVDMLRPMARSKEKEIKVRCENFKVETDRDLTFRAFLNLIENAIRHSRGNVEIDAADGMVIITDKGPELKRSSLNKGLGLRIATEMIHRIGGDLIVETSEHGNSIKVILGG